MPAQRRTIHDQAMRLANPCGNWAELRRLPGGEQILATWQRRRIALIAYREQLSSAEEIEPTSVLASLLHLHHLRTIGTDRDSERAAPQEVKLRPWAQQLTRALLSADINRTRPGLREFATRVGMAA